ncbi:hypothetical protein ACJ72_07622 [Emergomyces africanus]|uniref:Uncharacterized protein n=1 Tax=Emergomyces africanus TaxID=1955775 RepID=A0A1B7NMM4_9EURO|nr:hypothetical protein ACJ72_07622 [Emergomyces africanus]
MAICPAAVEPPPGSWTALAEPLTSKPTGEILALLALPRVRTVDMREGQTLNLNRPGKQEAVLFTVVGGRSSQKPCESCARGEGSFTACVGLPGHCREACACYYYSGMGEPLLLSIEQALHKAQGGGGGEGGGRRSGVAGEREEEAQASARFLPCDPPAKRRTREDSVVFLDLKDVEIERENPSFRENKPY